MGDMSTDRTLGGKGGREKWTLAEGATLGGYRVLKPLGRGGMGEVYLVENVQTCFKYALKLLPSDLASDSGLRERFRREAAVLQTLRHNGIVMVHHAAEEGDRFFLTMDYVEGRTLDDLLKESGKLPEVEAGEIALKLCDALSYAHAKGVIHRDIKPSNVLMDKDGSPKLSDFGLARIVGDDFLKSLAQRSISLSTARTVGGPPPSESDNAVIGTYEYMSPEQKAGQPADERTDIYSLGLVIYRMLTGEKAEGRFPLPSVLHCSDAWDDLVEKALATKPDGRYASVGEVAADVREAAEKADAEHAPLAEAERARRRKEEAQRRRLEERARAEGPVRAPRRAGRRSLKVLAVIAGMVVLGVFVSSGKKKAPRRRTPVSRSGGDTLRARPVKVAPRPPSPGEGQPTVATRKVSPPPSLAPTLTLDLGGGVRMEFVLIPAGEFMMGSRDTSAEVQRKANTKSDLYKNEHPRHRVRITRAFYMGKHEVTQAQYERIMGTNPSHFKGANLPVETVSWENATEFCRKLSQRTGRRVRLPTEAEWEYACRAGTSTPFHFGETISTNQVNYNANYPYAGGAKGTYREKTTSVGSFPANAWGLHDMHGNVWEWCSDWYDEGYYAKSPGTDPQGPGTGKYCVLRGGSWLGHGRYCRCADRFGDPPSARYRYYGFRVGVSAPGR